MGFRGDEFKWKKGENNYRILLLGDSFAFNETITEESVHTKVLQKKINKISKRKVEVINCGYADGYSPGTYAAFMLNRGFAMSPDLVIMQYYIRNDFKDLLENEVLELRHGIPFRVKSKYRYVDDAGRLRDRYNFLHKIPVLNESHYFVHIYLWLRINKIVGIFSEYFSDDYAGHNFVKNSYDINYRHIYFLKDDNIPDILEKALYQSLEYSKNLHHLCRENGVEFIFFLVPTGVQMSKEIWADNNFPELSQKDWEEPAPQFKIKDYLQQTGVTVFNPIDIFREQAKKQVLYLGANKDGHWTTAGCQVAAQSLNDFILNNNYIID